jgi:hypothetical protein
MRIPSAESHGRQPNRRHERRNRRRIRGSWRTAAPLTRSHPARALLPIRSLGGGREKEGRKSVVGGEWGRKTAPLRSRSGRRLGGRTRRRARRRGGRRAPPRRRPTGAWPAAASARGIWGGCWIRGGDDPRARWEGGRREASGGAGWILAGLLSDNRLSRLGPWKRA